MKRHFESMGKLSTFVGLGNISKIAFASIILISVTLTVEAQKFKKKSQYLSIGPTVNAINYFGELDADQSFLATSLKFTRWNLGCVLEKRVHPRITARTAISWGRIEGNDSKSSNTQGWDVYRNARNLTFRNDLLEFKLDGVVDLFQNRKGIEKRIKFNPYGFLGVGLLYHNPKGYFAPKDEWVALQPLGTEGQNVKESEIEPYSRLQIVVPFGIGIRYKVSVLWDVAFEIGWRKTFTDYLDDVGGKFTDKANFAPLTPEYYLSDPSIYADNNPLGTYKSPEGHRYTKGFENGEQRGGRGNDWYVVTGFHITYIFHPKLASPKFKG